MPLTLTEITPPTDEPVSLDEAREQMRVDANDEDALIMGYIAAARRYVEHVGDIQMVSATSVLRIPDFPRTGKRAMRLPKPPMQSVTSIKYLDVDGTQQTLDASGYIVDPYSRPGRIVEAYGTTWPSTRGVINAVEITFVHGYGGPTAVPATLRHAVMLLAAHWNEHREAAIAGMTTRAIEFGVRNLIAAESAHSLG